MDIKTELLSDARADTRLILYFEDEMLVGVEIDEQATESAWDRIKNKYERLTRGEHTSQY